MRCINKLEKCFNIKVKLFIFDSSPDAVPRASSSWPPCPWSPGRVSVSPAGTHRAWNDWNCIVIVYQHLKKLNLTENILRAHTLTHTHKFTITKTHIFLVYMKIKKLHNIKLVVIRLDWTIFGLNAKNCVIIGQIKQTCNELIIDSGKIIQTREICWSLKIFYGNDFKQ